ncbi:hypothetical protein ElyMa_001901000 [Elysia marginata]|uniref:G-protein coupled receptors family 1 profile domain-containing protein n=1 Tax=Elysia marginata TaxID=1093978 RepID=A0AAV4ET31_9GAST|nr:hypothetical protein ElyMa_001901000 [Elysia marginata]
MEARLRCAGHHAISHLMLEGLQIVCIVFCNMLTMCSILLTSFTLNVAKQLPCLQVPACASDTNIDNAQSRQTFFEMIISTLEYRTSPCAIADLLIFRVISV